MALSDVFFCSVRTHVFAICGSNLTGKILSKANASNVDNKELFISEEEYMSISGIQSTLLRDSDTVDFMRRPMLLEDGEIASASFLFSKIIDMPSSSSSSQTVGW